MNTFVDDREESSNQECRYVRGHAAGRSRLCYPGHGEVQHRKGHRSLHQERVRQEVQPNVARNRRQKLRKLRHTRNEAFHLLLPWTSCHSPLQVRLNNRRLRKNKRPSIILHRNILLRTFICSFFCLACSSNYFYCRWV